MFFCKFPASSGKQQRTLLITGPLSKQARLPVNLTRQPECLENDCARSANGRICWIAVALGRGG